MSFSIKNGFQKKNISKFAFMTTFFSSLAIFLKMSAIISKNKYHPFKNILLDMDSKENKENDINDDRNIPMNDLS